MSPRSSKKPARESSADAPAPDVYVGLLFVGFLSLVAGCVLIALELTNQYAWKAFGS
jgi:hypothetical protein